MKRFCCHKLAIAGVAGAIVAAPVSAANYAKEGKFELRECFVGDGPRVESAGVAFGSQILHSAAHSNAPSGGPLDDYGAYCMVLYVENAKSKSVANGYCEQTDRDGDKWLSTFIDEGNTMSGKFEAIGGTGKYVGAKIEGVFKPVGPLFFGSAGHVQRCLEVTGTYKLR